MPEEDEDIDYMEKQDWKYCKCRYKADILDSSLCPIHYSDDFPEKEGE